MADICKIENNEGNMINFNLLDFPPLLFHDGEYSLMKFMNALKEKLLTNHPTIHNKNIKEKYNVN
jgi:hypothetical protein